MSKETPKPKEQSEIMKAFMAVVTFVRKHCQPRFITLDLSGKTSHEFLAPSRAAASAAIDAMNAIIEQQEAAEKEAAEIAAVEQAATAKFLAGGIRPENTSRSTPRPTKPKPPSGT